MSLDNIQESNLTNIKEIIWGDATTQTTANTYSIVGVPTLLNPVIPTFVTVAGVPSSIASNLVPAGGYVANVTYLIEVTLLVVDDSGGAGLRGGTIIVTPADALNPSEVTQQVYGNLSPIGGGGGAGLQCVPSTTLQLIYTVPAVVPASGLDVSLLLPNAMSIDTVALTIQFTPLLL
jgi:hypothetical protein